ncbi:MAG TPA: 3-phosphoshikimate 1-carboxyvinyltransferase [Bacteroidales bacterium]|nr:3-phosphoshikimate 1-carboxyvinyltransferase [Bacteroidales bacterium]HPT12479.1 3-phosphoshikimate 1-carboxyvinyltransferase [Bacteroidales bacterium]
MIKTLHPSEIRGEIIAPSSKSETQRAIAAALLAHGETIIKNPSYCNDSLAAIEMAKVLGASVEQVDNSIVIKGRNQTSENVVLNCGESGLAMRMFSPIASLICDHCTITGQGSLLKRPVNMVTDALSKLGVTAESSDGFLPVTLNGVLKGGKIEIEGSKSSQLLTGLLMSLPLVEDDSEVQVINLKSKPYIDLTIQVLNTFGINVENEEFKRFIIPGRQKYHACEYSVEGDWSGAAFILVAGAIAGYVTVKNLNPETKQADIAILSALKLAGANISVNGNEVTANKSELRPFNFDATESPDLFPPLAALAVYCNGTSSIRGVSRLEYKESDRAITIMNVLGRMGIKTYIQDDDLIVEGGKVMESIVSSHNDHRIAMMAAVTALGASGNVTITEAKSVEKSYPGFFDDLRKLNITIS